MEDRALEITQSEKQEEKKRIQNKDSNDDPKSWTWNRQNARNI